MTQNNKSGFLALLGAAFILGTFGIWIRELDNAFSNTGQVIARSLMALLIISTIVIFKRKTISFKIERKNYKYLLGFCIVFPFSLICFTASATQIKVTNSLFMLYVGSLIASYLWGKLAFKESLNANKVVSITLLLLGLYAFVYPFDVGKLSGGIFLGLAAGALEGSAHAFRKFLKGVQREIIVFFQSLSSVVIAIILALYGGESLVKGITPSTLLVVVLFGALLVAIGYMLAYGFSHYDINVGSIILATELFFALVVSAIFLQELPTTYEIIGGLLIFTGAIVTSLDKQTFISIKKFLKV